MNLKKLTFTSLAAIFLPCAVSAAVVDGGSYGDNATGNSSYNVTFNAPTIQYFNVQATGILDSFTLWIDLASNAFNVNEDLVLELYGNFGDPTAELTDILATTTIDSGDLSAGQPVIGGNGESFVAATWNLSSLMRSAIEEDRFGVRAYASGPSGQFKISGNNSLSSPGLPAPDPLLGLSRFSGSQTDLGNSGSPVNVWGYELLVDTPAPIPLPAALPLLFSALASLGIWRQSLNRKKR